MYRYGLKPIVLLILYFVIALTYTNAAEHKKQIVCLGDEVTRGMWREEMIGNGTRWVDILASYDKNTDIINAGVDGMKAGNIEYLNHILDEYPNAEMYIIYLGINDLKKIKAINPAAVASVGAKVLRMVRAIKLKAPEAEITIIAPQRIYFENASKEQLSNGVGEQSEVLSEMLDGSLAVVAKRENVRFIELIDQIQPQMLADGVNPNVAGHAKIAELVWNEISHPFTKSDSVMAQNNIAPPPVGVSDINKPGTESLVSAVAEDVDELRGMGSKVENVGKGDNFKARAKNYVDYKQVQSVITKDAYNLGNSISKALVKKAESILIYDIDKVMEAQFINPNIKNSNETEICYKLPEPSRVESYITTINTGSDKNENLAEAVDWDQVEFKPNAIEKDSEQIVVAEKVNADSGMKNITQDVDIAEVAEKDIIKENAELTEVWLPELDLGAENTAQKANTEIKLAELEKAEESTLQIKNNEVKEVFAVSEKIEYTGYEVLVHTGIYE